MIDKDKNLAWIGKAHLLLAGYMLIVCNAIWAAGQVMLLRNLLTPPVSEVAMFGAVALMTLGIVGTICCSIFITIEIISKKKG